MASIRDYAVTINVVATASMVCEMPTHVAGEVNVKIDDKDIETVDFVDVDGVKSVIIK